MSNSFCYANRRSIGRDNGLKQLAKVIQKFRFYNLNGELRDRRLHRQRKLWRRKLIRSTLRLARPTASYTSWKNCEWSTSKTRKRKTSKTRLTHQIRLLSQLKHPNIVTYKESFLDKEYNMYIVMKYCEEGDLYKKIRATNSKPFSENQVLEWVAQLVLALHFLHEKKILHRDIKTQNIFISKGRLFLGDFGISKSLDNTRELANTVR